MILEGIYAPVPTPFDLKSGDISHSAMEDNIRRWAVTSLNGLVICGSNGELPFISVSERAELTRTAKLALEKSGVDKKIITGTFMHSTRETIDCSVRAADAGADAVLILPPHYFKAAGMSGAKKFFEETANSSPIPIVLYNMPGNTGVNLDAETVIELSRHPNIIGVKDTSGDMTQMCRIANECGENFSVFCGSGNYLLPSLAVGASGGTLAVANLYPESAARLLKACMESDMPRARALQYRLMLASDALTRKFGVPGLKASMDRAGLYGGPCRSPLSDLGDDEKHRLFDALDSTGLDEYESWRHIC
ncbi:MAG: dihydrodipicolinate synthase family protein [Synergistaceae bacterium]|jgi:4-hydroxy-2-oxoglutarate aldolase|nr:dihydrodipicolinate synthase family protein [Synergistaceae bacterium]